MQEKLSTHLGLKKLVSSLVVASILVPNLAMPRLVRADDDIPKTLSGKIEQVLDDDELIISTDQGQYTLDLPDACKGAVLSGKLKVGMSIVASGMLDPGDRELDVRTLRKGNQQICP